MLHVFLLIAIVFLLVVIVCAFATFSRDRRQSDGQPTGRFMALGRRSKLGSLGRLVLPPAASHAPATAE
jgi:hypothetical protein